MIKNRFHSSLKKRFEENKSNNNISHINININKEIEKIKDKDSNYKLNLNNSLSSTEAITISNLKENSTASISKVSYQPFVSLQNNKVEKDDKKNIDLQANSLFNNNELYGISFDDEDDYNN